MPSPTELGEGASTGEAGGSRHRSLLELRRARRDPIGFLQRTASRGDVADFILADSRVFLLSHPRDIEAVLVTDGAMFAKSPALDRAARLLGRGLLTVEAPLHAIRKRAIAPTFHRQRLSRYAEIMTRHASGRADRWQSGEPIDMVEEMSALTLGVVGEAFFGADLEAVNGEIRQILATAIGTLDPLVALIAPMRRLRPARARLDAIVQDLIDHRLADPAPPDDLLTLLLEAEGTEATPEQLHDDLITMLLAGHDTIANALSWTWWWIATHSEAEAAFHREVDTVLAGRTPTLEDVTRLPYTRAVLAESLRLRPPAWILARRALADYMCGGVTIPEGSLVIMSPYLVHRDERFHPRPFQFEPGRWMQSGSSPTPKGGFFAFGAGRRSCIGESFAWTEGVIMLAALAQRWRFRSMDTAVDFDARITLRPRGPLTLRTEARG